jgi:hypothetical protein
MSPQFEYGSDSEEQRPRGPRRFPVYITPGNDAEDFRIRREIRLALEGTGISFKVDSRGRVMFYREAGYWLSYSEVIQAMRK